MAIEIPVKPNTCMKFDHPRSGEYPRVILENNDNAVLVLTIDPTLESEGTIVVAHFGKGAMYGQLFQEALNHIRGISGAINISIIHGASGKSTAVASIESLFIDSSFTKAISKLAWRNLTNKQFIPIKSAATIKFEKSGLSIPPVDVDVPETTEKQKAASSSGKSSFWDIFSSSSKDKRESKNSGANITPSHPRTPSPPRQS